MLWRTPEPKRRLRRRHRRRRRPRAGDRLLPGQATTASPTSPCSSAAGWRGGNMARNTTIIRSNYLWDESAGDLRALARSCGRGWRRSSTTTSCSASAACSTSRTACTTCARACAASRPTGSTASTPSGWTPTQVKEVCPIVNVSPDVRYPVLGATFQPRAGIAKHDHVAWGFARAADALRRRPHPGLRGHRGRRRRTAASSGVRDDARARSRRGRVALCAAGHTSVLAAMAGLRLPMQSHPLQALVSELLEPVHPTASSCPTPCTSTSARRTRASW